MQSTTEAYKLGKRGQTKIDKEKFEGVEKKKGSEAHRRQLTQSPWQPQSPTRSLRTDASRRRPQVLTRAFWPRSPVSTAAESGEREGTAEERERDGKNTIIVRLHFTPLKFTYL